MIDNELFGLISTFEIKGAPVSQTVCNNGHINNTHIVTCKDEEGTEYKYILQRINTDVFKKPYELMQNIENITDFLRKKIASEGGNPERQALTLVKNEDGKFYKIDENGCMWRVYVFVPGTVTYDTVDNPEIFEKAGYTLGCFQNQLADYPADQLSETIPDFHNTVSRYNDFLKAVSEDKAGRAASVAAEIEFIKERAGKCSYITDRIASGKIPLRVTHNDTKLNNILMDEVSGEGICVIDLDTVMPGSVLYDFGDSIRFGASGAAEDERDLDKVSVKMELYEAFTRGFLRGLNGALNQEEIDALPMGAYIITLETGMRFLGDYLNGDIYFSIHREGQNLDRARTQLKLVWDMESKMDEMRRIAREII